MDGMRNSFTMPDLSHSRSGRRVALCLDVHVVPTEHSWEVRRDGVRQPSLCCATRSSALRVARVLAAESGAQVIVHEIAGSEP
jgi:hypothetical protein